MNKILDAKILSGILKERKEPVGVFTNLLTVDSLEINEFLTRTQYFYGTLSLT